jgi:hypothetical protein
MRTQIFQVGTAPRNNVHDVTAQFNEFARTCPLSTMTWLLPLPTAVGLPVPAAVWRRSGHLSLCLPVRHRRRQAARAPLLSTAVTGRTNVRGLGGAADDREEHRKRVRVRRDRICPSDSKRSRTAASSIADGVGDDSRPECAAGGRRPGIGCGGGRPPLAAHGSAGQRPYGLSRAAKEPCDPPPMCARLQTGTQEDGAPRAHPGRRIYGRPPSVRDDVTGRPPICARGQSGRADLPVHVSVSVSAGHRLPVAHLRGGCPVVCVRVGRGGEVRLLAAPDNSRYRASGSRDHRDAD